jgi:TPR repeat protein
LKTHILKLSGLALLFALIQPLHAATLEDAIAAAKMADFKTAASIYEPLAEQGDVTAQYELGKLYYRGMGVEQSYEQAAKWHRRAAEQGHAEAQYSIAAMHFNRDIPTRDYREAADWYLKAAEQGHAKAQLNVGILYFRGDIFEQNLEEALKWYQRAAEQGNAEAQFNLGNMYVRGIGVPEDLVRGTMWILVSIENPDVGKRIIGKTKVATFYGSKMTEEQRQLTRTLANECKAKQYKGC